MAARFLETSREADDDVPFLKQPVDVNARERMNHKDTKILSLLNRKSKIDNQELASFIFVPLNPGFVYCPSGLYLRP